MAPKIFTSLSPESANRSPYMADGFHRCDWVLRRPWIISVDPVNHKGPDERMKEVRVRERPEDTASGLKMEGGVTSQWTRVSSRNEENRFSTGASRRNQSHWHFDFSSKKSILHSDLQNCKRIKLGPCKSWGMWYPVTAGYTTLGPSSSLPLPHLPLPLRRLHALIFMDSLLWC
jgi:hypothetical protein